MLLPCYKLQFSNGRAGEICDTERGIAQKNLQKVRVKLHKAEFRERDEKLPDLTSSLRRLASRAYPEAVPHLQDSLAKDQFIDALEDREIRIKLRESAPKTLDEAVRRALQIEAMYEAESRRSKGRSVWVVQELLRSENSELVELLKQNTAAMNQIVNFVQQQQQEPSGGPKRNGRGLEPNAWQARDRRFRLCFKCHKKGHFIADCKKTLAASGKRL